jgi:hypothetical protein
VNQISQCAAQEWSAGEVFIEIRLASALLGTPGSQLLELVTGDVDAPEGWAFFDDGVLNEVDFIQVTSNGTVEIHPTIDLTGVAILVIPPFVKALTSVQGIVNGGGILEFDFTP